jgi:hypothetical protein
MSFISKIFGYETKEVELSDDSDFQTESEDEKEENILENLLFENSHVKLYKTQAKNFVNNVQIWVGQRPLNNEHIKSLAREFTNQEHVIGTFKVVRSQDGNIRLLDGQHRVNAIKEILKLQPEFNCDLLIELYEIDRLESNSALRLFEKANNVLNVKPEDMPNKNALAIVNKLSSQFKLIFKNIEQGKRCVRPYINENKLIEKLKNAFQKYDIDEDILYQKILERNEDNKNLIEIVDLSPSSIEKCKRSGCYLGLEKDLIWLEDILSIY